MDEFDYSPNLPDVETRTNLYRGLLEHLDKTVFGEKFDLPQSESGQYTSALNPIEAFDKERFPEGAIFAEPETKWTESQIRGLPSKLAKIVRKAMQNELKARGPSPFEASTKTFNERVWAKTGGPPLDAEPEIVAATNAVKESDVTSRLLRGSWYRGQDKYPSQARVERVLDPSTGKEVEEYVTKQFGKEYGTEAPVFAGLRAKQSNLGEPHGISLSYDPNVSTEFGAPSTISESVKDEVIEKVGQGLLPDKLVGRAARLADTQKVSRVMPLYGEAPEGKILQVWKPEHGQEFREAYLDTAKEMAEKYPEFRKSIEILNPGASGEEIKNAIQKVQNKDIIDKAYHIDETGKYQETSWKVASAGYGEKYKSSRDELNSLMSKKLMEKGYKGMLHSPHRYQEYELRMFDPYDVMYIDKRAVADKYASNPMQSKAVVRLNEMKSALKREHETVTEGKSKTLADWYRDITREEILGLPKASNTEVNDSIAGDFGKEIAKKVKAADYNALAKKFPDWGVSEKIKAMVNYKQSNMEFDDWLGSIKAHDLFE
jgi:hypothetical protein